MPNKNDEINPNSSNYMFGAVLTKLESMERKQSDHHTEFMDRFDKHEEIDDARHKSNTERLDSLEGDRKKVIGAVIGVTAIGGFIHWIVDVFRK